MRSMRGQVGTLVIAIPVVIMLLPLGYSVVHGLVAKTADEPFLERPDEPDCDGRDREFMRFHHMDLLKEIRDEVIREGIRGEVQRGLARCRDCHTNRDRFCNECHHLVNLTPDCFDCHYYP
jgi:hypothetical protein